MYVETLGTGGDYEGRGGVKRSDSTLLLLNNWFVLNKNIQ